MRTIEFFINGEPVDFETIDNLNLSLKVEADKFFSIGKAGGVGLDSPLKAIVLPVSKSLVKAISGNPTLPVESIKGVEFEAYMLVNGVPVFSGSARLQNFDLHSIPQKKGSFNLLGDGKRFWSLLENISLRDLDLGTQLWTKFEIIDSFTKNFFQGKKGLFAPVLYGLPSGDGGQSWRLDDFRFHVYERAILEAICFKAGYRLNSSFINAQIFTESVHLYHGEKYPEFEIPPSFCQLSAIKFFTQTINNFEIVTLTNAGGGGTTDCAVIENSTDIRFLEAETYDFSFNAFAEGNFGNFGAEIWKNGTPVVFVPSQPETSNQFSYEKDFSLDLEIDDVVQVYMNGVGDLKSVNLQISGTTLNPNNSVFYVASCLPDKGAKEFIKGIAHKYNLAFEIDDIRKSATVEPRFNYKLFTESKLSQGFYLTETHTGNFETSVKSAEADLSSLKRDYPQPFGKSVELFYPLQSEYAKENYQNDADGLKPYSAKFDFKNKKLKATESPNPYYNFLPQGDFLEVIGGDLPVLFSNYNSDSETPIPSGDEINYSNFITGGLVYRNKTVFRWEGEKTNSLAPWISQFVEKKYNDGLEIDTIFTVAYGDHLARNAPLGFQRYSGLGSIFYRDYFSTIRAGVVIFGDLNISFWKIANFSFRFLRRFDLKNFYGFWIITELNKFQPTKFGLTGFKAILKNMATLKDRIFFENCWNLRSYPTNGESCDYTADTGTFVNGEFCDIEEIILSNYYKLPLTYPYRSTEPADVARLKEDLENFLLLLNVSFTSVTVNLNGYTWTVSIFQSDIIFERLRVKVNDNSFNLTVDFEAENCN